MNREAETREQILESASRVYIKWGLKKTTMEDIAAEAGKGKATLYYYFKNKEEVFKSVLNKLIDEHERKVMELLGKYESAADKIKQYLRVMYASGKEQNTLYRFLRMDIREDPKLLKLTQEKFESHCNRFVREILEDGINNNEFTPWAKERISFISQFISTSITKHSISCVCDLEDVEDMDDRIQTVSDFIVRGLASR